MFDTLLKPFTTFGISAGFVLLAAGAVGYLSFFPPQFLPNTIEILVRTAPLWLTVVFFIVFKGMWMTYTQTRQFMETDYVLLEIKLPEEITQSPLAMETALNAFFHTGEPNTPIEKYIEGKLRAQFSLEIVSLEGSVHFFIRTREKLSDLIEAQLYSQYPTIEVHRVEDYIPSIPYDPEVMNLFGVYQKLQKPDPYPIKTYVDFGLDRETDEEYKIDPLSSILEAWGSLGTGEYGLFQIIIRSHQAEKRVPGKWFKKEDWREEAKREIDEIIKKVKGNGDAASPPRSFTEGERMLIEALERNISKKPFDTGIRTIYMGRKENYRSSCHSVLPTMLRSFESHTLNGFKPTFPTNFSYSWQDPFGRRAQKAKQELYDGYRWRSYLAPPYEHPYFVLSAEELATVYHFPGRVAQTPTIGRIPSRREEAPPNVPR